MCYEFLAEAFMSSFNNFQLIRVNYSYKYLYIQRRVDGWTDRNDILAALRASNYDVEDCIRNKYLTAYSPISLSSHASAADHNLLQAKERKIHDLELQLTQLVRLCC